MSFSRIYSSFFNDPDSLVIIFEVIKLHIKKNVKTFPASGSGEILSSKSEIDNVQK
jgi:hypothetical protein